MAFSLITQLQNLNQVISQDLRLGFNLFPQTQTDSVLPSVSLPVLIPYQSGVILNQTLLKKMIERFVRAYIELQQEITENESWSRDHLKGLIELSYWEPELSDIQLSSVMKEIGRIIRDTGELSQEEYQELRDGNIVFDINDYSTFEKRLAMNQVGVKIQEKIETIQIIMEDYFQKSYPSLSGSQPELF